MTGDAGTGNATAPPTEATISAEQAKQVPMQKDGDKKSFWSREFSLLSIVGAVIVGFFVGASQITDGVEKMLIFFHFRPDAFSVGEDNARSVFSKHLIEVAWTRLFVDRNYVRTLELGLDASAQEAAWKAYADAVRTWNVEIMNSILGVQQYYGTAKRNFLEQKVQGGFSRASDCISKMRYPDYWKKLNHEKCEGANPDPLNMKNNFEIAYDILDDLNRDLYCFASGLTKEKATCE